MFLFFPLPALARTLLIACIAILTLVSIMIRPFKLDEARIALAGAGLLLVMGLIPPLDALATLLYVIDSGPHGELERQRERFLRSSALDPRRYEQMRSAETGSAQDILEEGTKYLPGAERIQRRGRPEREIVTCAQEWRADLVVICPRSPLTGGPTMGPKSVGHVARFVLDHAPCPVLLVRPQTGNTFSLPEDRL